MTNEESVQVAKYIENLNAEHAAQVEKLTKAASYERQSRIFAQQNEAKMVQAMQAVHELGVTQPNLDPKQLPAIVQQIITYFCPDYNIPF